MDNCNGSESNFSYSSSSALHFPLISNNNSFELNAISLSDDSGFTSHTNAKGENEHADINSNSDEFEEFSQFDSDSGMSAENFQTIKKFSNSIIYEPPPEFSDNYSKFAFNQSTTTSTAPSTVIRKTHIQSYATRLTQNIIKTAIKTFQNLATNKKNEEEVAVVEESHPPYYCEKHAAAKLKKRQKSMIEKNEYSGSCSVSMTKARSFVMSNEYSIYGSDSFLNKYHHKTSQLTNGKSSNSNINIVDSDEDDIYDEPNAEYDVIYKDNKNTILCTKRIVRSLEKKKHVDAIYCNTDEMFYEKLRAKSYSSSQNQQQSANNKDASNKFQSNSFQKKFDKFLRSKFLTTNLTPTTTTSSIFYSFCHTGTHNSNSNNICIATNHHPNSKSSLNSRLSSSHNSLTVPTNKADDSIFITQAMSHDQLQGHNIEISDFYNVPLDSDIYTLPIDVINNNHSHHNHHHHQGDSRKHSRHLISTCKSHCQRAMSDNDLLVGSGNSKDGGCIAKSHRFHRIKNKRSKRKKRNTDYNNESGCSRKLSNASGSIVTSNSFTSAATTSTTNHEHGGNRKLDKIIRGKSAQSCSSNDVKVRKNSSEVKVVVKSDTNNNNNGSTTTTASQTKKSQFSISLNLKQKFCSIFRFRKSSHQPSPTRNESGMSNGRRGGEDEEKKVNLSTRALPPLPGLDSDTPQCSEIKNEPHMDFAANIEKARECGWYWGALTSEAAEKILSNEPDGSFIVRDSSDLNYIFSLTVKLNGCIRHVRIEQEQGLGFSFGSCAQIKCSYKSSTIKEFIENAVEHSRSGRYLFFLHRRPEHGPMRVQLLNPVSRFRHVQSLQHMCRFVILKAVQRKDLIETLPLPRRLLDYLQNKNFLSELIESDSLQSQVYGEHNNSNNITINSDSN